MHGTKYELSISHAHPTPSFFFQWLLTHGCLLFARVPFLSLHEFNETDLPPSANFK